MTPEGVGSNTVNDTDWDEINLDPDIPDTTFGCCHVNVPEVAGSMIRA